MATATARKSAAAQPAEPITFDEINRRKVRERVEAYRDIVTRRATGGRLTVEDMERAAELLELLGLPQYTFDRDVEAVQKFNAVNDKVQAAIDAAPEHKQRAAALTLEVETTRKRLEALREEQRLATAKANKPAAYVQTVALLRNDHPHMLADIDDAVAGRIAELDRRKRIGGAA